MRRLRRFDSHLVRSDTRRALLSMVVAAAVVLVPLFSAWQVARAAAQESAPIAVANPVGGTPLAPILSVRRIARTAAIEARVANAQRELSRFAATLPGDSCLIATGDTRTLVNVRGDRALVPASNMKLLVAAGALEILGPDYRFETTLRAQRVGNIIVGNLWLVGGGDPLLSTRAYPPTQRYPTLSPTYLDALAEELAASGVTIVTGSIVGDESRYDQERFVPTWGDGIRAIEGGPLGALMVDDGSIVGQPFKPSNPAIAAATVFGDLLRARGINVIRGPQSGTAPDDATVIARLTSAPLRSILVDVLTNSDNNASDLLVKEMGLVAGNDPSRVGGLTAMADALERRGLPVDGLVLADGSGLDSGNRVPCALLTALLESYGAQSELGQALALGGATGTLQDVFTSGPARQRVRAKTGTLRVAKTLSGYFPVGDGHITFSLLLNGSGVSNQSTYLPAWNRLMAALASYNEAPTEQQLLPRQ